jgi:hypothetical protein
MKRGVGTGLMTFGGIIAVVGAIMRYAVSVHTDGFNIHIAGMILLVVGVGMVVIGLIAMLLGGRTTSTHETSVQNTPDGQVRTSEWDERTSI